MGQYYKYVNVDKKEFMRSWSYDCGAKLMEHSYIGDDGMGNHFSGAFIQLLMNEWCGDCVVLVGDYADEEYMLENYPELWDKFVEKNPWLRKRKEYDGKYYSRSLYDCDSEDFSDGADIGYSEVTGVEQTEKCPRYAVNYDKHEYVDLYNPTLKSYEWEEKETGKKHNVLIFALNLLLAIGNGLGGGDYHGTDEELVGSWAGDEVGLEDEIPEGYGELLVGFNEKW